MNQWINQVFLEWLIHKNRLAKLCLWEPWEKMELGSIELQTSDLPKHTNFQQLNMNKVMHNFEFQYLLLLSSSSLFLLLSLSFFQSLRERAGTILRFHHTTENFISTFMLTDTQAWYIIEIVSLSPTHFHSERLGLIRVTNDLPFQY